MWVEGSLVQCNNKQAEEINIVELIAVLSAE